MRAQRKKAHSKNQYLKSIAQKTWTDIDVIISLQTKTLVLSIYMTNQH